MIQCGQVDVCKNYHQAFVPRLDAYGAVEPYKSNQMLPHEDETLILVFSIFHSGKVSHTIKITILAVYKCTILRH